MFTESHPCVPRAGLEALYMSSNPRVRYGPYVRGTLSCLIQRWVCAWEHYDGKKKKKSKQPKKVSEQAEYWRMSQLWVERVRARGGWVGRKWGWLWKDSSRRQIRGDLWHGDTTGLPEVSGGTEVSFRQAASHSKSQQVRTNSGGPPILNNGMTQAVLKDKWCLQLLQDNTRSILLVFLPEWWYRREKGDKNPMPWTPRHFSLWQEVKRGCLCLCGKQRWVTARRHFFPPSL